MKIEIQKTDEEILRCFPIMKVLRPHLDEIDFLEKVRRQEKQGYQIAACIDKNEVHALAGFRIGEQIRERPPKFILNGIRV